MDPMTIFALISAVVGMISTEYSNAKNLENQQSILQQQQSYASQAATTANERALENWEKTESPGARVKQYKDAGLSVGLMYGGNFGGGVNTAPMAATPSTTNPVINPLLPNGLNDVFDNLLKAKQTEKTEKEGEEIEAKIKTYEQEIKESESRINCNIATEINTKLQNKIAELDIEIKTATKEDVIKTVRKQFEAVEQAVEEAKERIKELKTINKYKDDYLSAELNLLGAQYWNTVQDTFLKVAEEQLTYAKEWLTREQASLTQEQKNYYGELVAKTEQEVRIIRTKADHYESEFYLMEFGKSGSVSLAFGVLSQLEEMAEKWRDKRNHGGGAGGKF